MPLQIRWVSGDTMTTEAGQPFPFDLVAQVTEDGRPAADKTVVFTAFPPNSILFDGNLFASKQTNAQGLASIKPSGRIPGGHKVTVSLPGADRENRVLCDECDLVVTDPHEDEEEVQTVNGVTVVRKRQQAVQQSHFGWPHAAVALGALALAAAAILGALGAFEKAPPIVYPPPLPPQPPTPVVTGTADTQARDGVARVEGKVDALGVKLDEHADQEAEARGTGDFALTQRIQEDESIRNKLFQRALAAGYGPRSSVPPAGRSRWRVAFYPSP